MAQLTHDQYEQLEDAVRRGHRIAVQRRGAEYIIVPLALTNLGGREVIDARNPTTGDRMTLYLDELESIELVGR